MDTLLLDRTIWDLCLDAAGNIAVASDPYSLAQDAASAIKLFLGELYYDTAKGVPYMQQILGKSPSVQLLRTLFANAALTVPGIIAANVEIFSIQGRTVTGSVRVTDNQGVASVANF